MIEYLSIKIGVWVVGDHNITYDSNVFIVSKWRVLWLSENNYLILVSN